MPETLRVIVRETPVDLLRDGSGPPLLYLHGAGAGGRWLAFQERLWCPSQGSSETVEWGRRSGASPT